MDRHRWLLVLLTVCAVTVNGWIAYDMSDRLVESVGETQTQWSAVRACEERKSGLVGELLHAYDSCGDYCRSLSREADVPWDMCMTALGWGLER